MSLVEVNAVMRAIHDARQQQSRLQLFVTKLSRHTRSRNAAANEPQPRELPPTDQAIVATDASLAATPAQLHLARVLCDAQTLLVGALEPQQRGGVQARREDSQDDDDQSDTLCTLIETLRAAYSLPSGDHANAADARTPRNVNLDQGPLLSEIAGTELVSLLGLIFSVARTTDRTHARRIAAHQTNLAALLQQYQLSAPDGKVNEEIAKVNALATEDARALTVPYQSFAGPGAKSLLLHMIATKSWLSYVDLSHCLLGDQFVCSDVIPAAAALQHLAVLLLNDNALTGAVVPPLLQSLPAQTAQLGSSKATPMGGGGGGAVAEFPKLRVLNLEGNLIDPQLVLAVYRRLEETQALIPGLPEFAKLGVGSPSRIGDKAPSSPPQPLALLHCEAPCMHAAILARSLLHSHLTCGTTTDYNVFSGASFASVVAVSLLLKKTASAVWEFFERLASKVFVEYHYSFYAVAATRSIRRWWTGGDYYSSDALKHALVDLLGTDVAGWSMGDVFAKTGKHCMLVASTTQGIPVVFRSWRTTRDSLILPDATGTCNEGLSVTMLDALMACCAAPHMFAPVTPSGGRQPLRDLMAGSVDTVVAELLNSTSGPTAIQATVFTPSEPFAAQDLLDPSVHKQVAQHLKGTAEQKALASFNSASAWHDAQQATSMWGDVNLSVCLSALQRMCIATAGSANRLNVRSICSLKRQASSRRSAVRFDEHNLSIVEAMDENITAPAL